MVFFLTKLLSTFYLQYLCRVRAVGSKTEEYVQVRALCTRRHSGTLLFCPNNFPAETLTITLSLRQTVAFAVFHSPRDDPINVKCCELESTQLHCVVENERHAKHGTLVPWVSYLPSSLRIYLSAFPVLPLMQFFFFVHYCTGTSGKVGNS